jgi:hypothetical protein
MQFVRAASSESYVCVAGLQDTGLHDAFNAGLRVAAIALNWAAQ